MLSSENGISLVFCFVCRYSKLRIITKKNVKKDK